MMPQLTGALAMRIFTDSPGSTNLDSDLRRSRSWSAIYCNRSLAREQPLTTMAWRRPRRLSFVLRAHRTAEHAGKGAVAGGVDHAAAKPRHFPIRADHGVRISHDSLNIGFV